MVSNRIATPLGYCSPSNDHILQAVYLRRGKAVLRSRLFLVHAAVI
jgi:hypothetical protein